MRKIVTVAAVLTAIGSGAALAQGAPPGSAPWQSGWPSFVQSHPNQAISARKADTARSDSRRMTANSRDVGQPAAQPFRADRPS